MSRFRSPPPRWFRTVAIVLILWGMMGCFAWVQQYRLGAEAMGPATDYDRALYAALPPWYNAVYAVAVGTGLLGAIALLLRSALAQPLFAFSLVALLLQFGWFFATTDVLAVKGAATAITFPALIVAIGAFELWLAGLGRRRRWLSPADLSGDR